MTVNLAEAAAALTETWSPKVVGRVNDHLAKVAKLEGEFVWHSHAEEDELFLVLSGALVIRYRDRPDAHLKAGDLHIVPRGVEHNPLAEETCLILLLEPEATAHTGEVVVEGRTKTLAEQMGEG